MTMSHEDRSSSHERKGSRGEVQSRRHFIRGAGIGAAAALVGLGGSRSVLAGSPERALITLDALMITYFSATLGAAGSSLWRLNGKYANTIRLRAVEDPSVTLKGRVPEGEERVFLGHSVRQTRSSAVKNGISIRHRAFDGLSIGLGSNGPSTSNDTKIYGLLKPRLLVEGNARKLRFRFMDAESEFLLGVGLLREGDQLIDRDTIDSWLSNYVTEPARLTEPRFKFEASTGLTSAGVEHKFDVSETGDKDFSEARTAITTSRIIGQTGFTSAVLQRAFGVGSKIEITHAAVQEFPKAELIAMQTTLARTSAGVNDIYWDRVFKNFVVVDASI